MKAVGIPGSEIRRDEKKEKQTKKKKKSMGWKKRTLYVDAIDEKLTRERRQRPSGKGQQLLKGHPRESKGSPSGLPAVK
jgi:hypothetical protein